MDFPNFLKNADKSLFAIIVIALIYTFLISGIMKDLKQLPSPIFGGDLYYQLGGINHMYSTGISEWAQTSNGIGERPAYFITYGVLVTIFGKMLSLEPIRAMMNFNMLLPMASLFLFYFLFKKTFNDGWIAVLGAVVAVAFTNFPVFKYTEFTKLVVYPFFLLCSYYFFKEQNKRNSILLGVAYGVMALSHATAFVFGTLVVGVIIAYYVYRDFRGKKLLFSKEYVFEKKYFLVAALLGFLIAQIYWFGPIFLLHGNSQLKSHIWSFFPQQIFIGGDIITQLFFDASTPLAAARSLLAIIGVYAIARTDIGKSEDAKFFSVIVIILLAMIFSAYITMPLFEFHFAPGYLGDLYLSSTQVFISMFGFAFLVDKVKGRHKDAKAVCYVLLALLAVYHAFNAYPNWMKGDYLDYAKSDTVPVYASLKSYVFANTTADDVILTNNELGFMFNALTGRKLVVSRRAQNDVFTADFDQRELDAGIMLYGNNRENAVKLLKKYNVKYVYFDVYWFTADFHFDGTGKAVDYSDPFMVFYSAEKEKIWADNGVKTLKVHGYVDPAVRASGVKTYDLLLAGPDNYEYTGKGVWQNTIDDMLEPVWQYIDNGQIVAVLYKVKY